MRSRNLREALEQMYHKLTEQKASLPYCFLSEIVVSINALQKWQRFKHPSNEVRKAMLLRATYHEVLLRKNRTRKSAQECAEELTEKLIQEGNELLQGLTLTSIFLDILIG